MSTRAAPDRGRATVSTLPGIDCTLASENHGPRLGNPAWPDSLVLHYTGMADGPSAVAWLCNPASSVSCHYVVNEDGTILQLVPEDRRAWHAGRSSWFDVTDMNSASIGIEIVNGGHEFGLPPFPEPQTVSVIALCRDIILRHAIRLERILAHSDISPGRKRDPGEQFPWAKLAEAGVGHWPSSPPLPIGETLAPGMAGETVLDLQNALIRYGYGLTLTGTYDERTVTIVSAFQRHFRANRVDGIADPETQGTLAVLLARQEPAP